MELLAEITIFVKFMSRTFSVKLEHIYYMSCDEYDIKFVIE